MTVTVTAAECHNLVHGTEADRRIAELNNRVAALIKEKTDAELKLEQQKAEATRLSDLVNRHVQVRQNLSAQLTEALRKHAEDMETIGEALIEEAEARGWCSEYDDVISNLNDKLNGELPLRYQERMLVFTVRVPVRIRPGDEDEAVDDARQKLEAVDGNLDYMSESESVDASFEHFE